MNDRIEMTIRLPGLTPAQAIALHAMFRFWGMCGGWGCSRYVAFMVDGDGNFRVTPEVTWDHDLYAGMSEEEKQHLWRIAQVSARDETYMKSIEDRPMFDFDPVAWKLET